MDLFDLPTFLDKDGNWQSRDGSLAFKKPENFGSPKKPSIINKVKSKLEDVIANNFITKQVANNKGLLGNIKANLTGDTPEDREKSVKISQERQSLIGDLTAQGKSKEEAVKIAKSRLTLTQAEDIMNFVGGFVGNAEGGIKPKPKVGAADDIAKAATPDLSPNAITTGAATKERGFVSSVKEEFPQVKVAGQYIVRDTDKLAIKARNLINDDIATAEKIALTRTDDVGVAAGAQLIKHYGEKAIEATDDATRNALNDRAAEIANSLARRLTEQGRSVQAASILGRMTPEGQLRFAAREIQKYNEAVEKSRGGIFGLKKKVPELTGEQASEIVTEMKAIESLPDGLDKAMRFQKLQEKISDLVPSSLYQKMTAVWKAGLLTGVKTSGLNVFSNLTHATAEAIKDVPAVAVDKVSSLFTGKRTIGLTSGGASKGVMEGFEKGWQYFKTGFDERSMGTKLDYNRVNFGKGKIAKALQSYEETVFRIIGSEDQPFYYGAKARSLRDQAIAQGKTQGLKGNKLNEFVDSLVQNPTDEMVQYSVLDAETAVFQNKTILGKAAKKLQEVPGGQLIVPFSKTPSAVAVQILNYSPIGIFKTIAQNAGKGRFNQRLFSQGLGRGITGTGVLWLGSKLVKDGVISLDRPTTEREQKLWELEGRTPNSIRIGNKWRSAQVLGPIGSLLIVGAHFGDELSRSGSPTAAITKAIVGGAKSFTENTFLRGLNDVVEALSDPQRFGVGYFGNLAASSIPTLVSDVARSTDPKERRSTGIVEKVQARVPGLRRGLEPQVDVLGRERESVGNPLEILADPTRPSGDISTPTVREFRRLTDAGFKVSPTLPGDKNGFAALTPEQNTMLWKRSGEIVNEKVSNLINSEAYQGLPDDLKAKKIEEFVDRSKLMARVEAVLALTEGVSGSELKKKLSELKKGGVLNQEVYEKFMELR